MSQLTLENFSENIEKFKAEYTQKLEDITQKDDLEGFRVSVFGKKGQMTEILKSLKDIDPVDKPQAGKLANELRVSMTDFFESKKKKIESEALNKKLQSERIDHTLPAVEISNEYAHPIQWVQDEIVAIFENCGFVVEIGPEVESEFYNFDALNFAKDHPARTMQDTFFVKGKGVSLLRTHTSPVQIRTMQNMEAPIRMISPGRVYRSDYDPTHSPMFHQVEGLVVDRGIDMGHLKGILEHMIREFFGDALKVRLRPSFFPFTEPSAEFDMECCFCAGKGCSVCKKTGWIEIGGCGMVDPEVFKSVEMNPGQVRGFAFGMGVERMAMLKYGIEDIRLFYESDQRFVQQFARYSQ